MWIENRNFSLANEDPEKDQRNRETLMILIKKCRELTLHRIERTHVVYEMIGANAESFQHLEALTLEFHLPYLKYLKHMTKLKNVKILRLNQAFYDSGMNVPTSQMSDAIIGLIQGLGGRLREFSFQPLSQINSVYIMAACHEQLRDLVFLDITVSDEPVQLGQMLEILQHM